MNEPQLILVDEPTSALDTKLGTQVMELIVNEVKRRATAAIIVTHDTRMTHYADRVVQITDGVLARMTLQPGDRLPPVELVTAGGDPVELGAFLERTLLVVAIRYYG